MERTAGPFHVALVVAEESPDPVAGEGFRHACELKHLRHHEEHDQATIRIDSDIALNLRNNGYGLRRDRGLRGQILNQRLQITPPGCRGFFSVYAIPQANASHGKRATAAAGSPAATDGDGRRS